MINRPKQFVLQRPSGLSGLGLAGAFPARPGFAATLYANISAAWRISWAMASLCGQTASARE